jgi:RNA polymerase sigma-70 factor, ECF subfamily
VLHDDKQLVEDAKNDKQAFAALYDKYFDQIYRYVYRRVSDKDTVHDLVSQTFLDALTHIDEFEWRGFPFSAWLYKIAHNNVLKWYRENGKAQIVEIDEGMQIVDEDSDSTEMAEQSESKELIAAVMEKLEPEEREIIRLKFFEEASNIEIAEIMGLSPNHIGVKVFRVLKKVKQLLS